MGKHPVYLIFGAEGVLGRSLLARLGSEDNKSRVFAFPHLLADITETSHIAPLMEYIRPTMVINCAGVSDPDLCEDAKQGAFLVNGEGSKIVAEAAKKFEAKMVGFSTSSVFDGNSSGPYNEDDKISPICIHGQSKAVGEENIKQTSDNHLIIRLGWVLNYEGGNWVTQWVDNLDAGHEVPAINDITGSASYLPDIMDSLMDLMLIDAKGTFNLANGGQASQYEMAGLLGKLMGAKKKRVQPIGVDSQKWWKAPISRNTALDCSKYASVGKTIRPWQDAIRHCLFTMGKYKPD
jgi:dTDP-4-dehydrorhamnose reductase